MGKTNSKTMGRKRRQTSIRKKLVGTAARPRLAVFRSSKNIYVQIVDDATGRTLVAASSLSPEVKGKVNGGNKDGAAAVGALVAKKCKEVEVSTVVFDRGGNRYHGRVAALADAAREGGLSF